VNYTGLPAIFHQRCFHRHERFTTPDERLNNDGIVWHLSWGKPHLTGKRAKFWDWPLCRNDTAVKSRWQSDARTTTRLGNHWLRGHLDVRFAG